MHKTANGDRPLVAVSLREMKLRLAERDGYHRRIEQRPPGSRKQATLDMVEAAIASSE